jgi:hypothetical protein
VTRPDLFQGYLIEQIGLLIQNHRVAVEVGESVGESDEPIPIYFAYSLHRLYHYTGTDPEYFQNFVILTNYQFYADAFAVMGRERMRAGEPAVRTSAFVRWNSDLVWPAAINRGGG